MIQGFPMTFRDATRHPPLLQFLACVPIEMLNLDGRFRGLYHRAIAPWVTPMVRERRTKNNLNPLALLPPRTEAILRDLARGTALERNGYVDGPKLASAFEVVDTRESLWNYLAAERWLRECA